MENGSSSARPIYSMHSNSHPQGFAKSTRTPRTDRRWLLPSKSGSVRGCTPSGFCPRSQSGLEALKDDSVASFGTVDSEVLSRMRNPARISRTPRTESTRPLSPESGFQVTFLPSGFCARMKNALEGLSSNISPLFDPSDATYHSIGWEEVTDVAQLARRVSVLPPSGSRLSTRVSFARRRVATPPLSLTMQS